jgi:hypothetical protein
VLTFANGMGMDMRWPVFAAIVPEIVLRPTYRRRLPDCSGSAVLLMVLSDRHVSAPSGHANSK